MHIKIVENNDIDKFEDEVNQLLNTGYKILSSNCSMINSEAYDFCSFYQAMLLTNEKTFTRKEQEIEQLKTVSFLIENKAMTDELQRLQAENEELKKERKILDEEAVVVEITEDKWEQYQKAEKDRDHYKQALEEVYKIALSSLDCGEWIGQGDDKVERILNIINEVLKDETY